MKIKKTLRLSFLAQNFSSQAITISTYTGKLFLRVNLLSSHFGIDNQKEEL